MKKEVDLSDIKERLAKIPVARNKAKKENIKKASEGKKVVFAEKGSKKQNGKKFDSCSLYEFMDIIGIPEDIKKEVKMLKKKPSNKKIKKENKPSKNNKSLSEYFSYVQDKEFKDSPICSLASLGLSSIIVCRKVKLTVKNIINEHTFNPVDDTKEREYVICEIISFDDKIDDEEADAIFYSQLKVKSGCPIVWMYAEKDIDSYLNKVKDMEA